jgi:hypothetical protein
MQRSMHSNERRKYWWDSAVLSILGGVLSNYLYDQIRKHSAFLRKLAGWVALGGAMYLVTVGGMMLATIFVTFPLDDPIMPWMPLLTYPWQTYFVWGVPAFMGVSALTFVRALLGFE